ncbi:TonB-dependent receptor [Granulicella sp. L60]|uniref:TonB-dependent receptor n=1 Tax=Granulicella sp. L60 TaxID=1641866 RepID=UPI00131D0FA1|nr:TonB-dependent receptor [Granulicella sp. L60]
MRKLALFCTLSLLIGISIAHASSIFSQLRGVVHDPQHRPIAGVRVELHAANSAFTKSTLTNPDGSFTLSSIPLGDYTVTVSQPGFSSIVQTLTLASDTAPILHFELQLNTVQQSTTVTTETNSANVNTVTPTALISREDIAQTPGADRTNSMAMITDYVPGAYMTHDMLHMRGGHQVSWLIDGVQIPNTNIASNLGAQIDPKDIDYIEVQRGSYTADTGDRTYGVFNVVPRTGFERTRQAELVLSAGSFLQTNDQINLGDHTEKFAYYASLNGNRSDYGLSPPIGQTFHDATNGYGGFASLIYNRTPKDQFRLVSQARNDFFQIPYDPNSNDFENQQFDSSGLRDVQHETDGIAALSWLHTFNPSTVLQVSPFFHYNRADYDANPNDTPVATTSHRSSTYGGAQASITTEIAHNTLEAGFYSFGQHDNYLFGAIFNDGSGTAPFSIPDSANGGVIEEYVSDNYKPTSWLTLIAGLRQTHFQGAFTENETDPRVGAAIRIPKLNWVFRGFYGRFYQPPPLLTAAGPIVQFAQANDTSFTPLHGERDEEHQFGVQIPYRGWLLDADTFKTRVNNFLDHSNIGDSSIYFPVTVDGALIRAWELTLRSPRLAHVGQFHLAYSNQIAEQRGAITGGLICFPVTSPECDVAPGYTPVDHDQRNTLNVGFNASLPFHTTASTNVYYGSGFTNGDPDPNTPYPNAYLPEHTTFDVAIGKTFGENINASITATNVANRRVLLDNSLTFGGFHYNDPREIFAQLRYRFKF